MRFKRRAPVRQPLIRLALVLVAFYVAQQWFKAERQDTLGQQMAALVRPGDILMMSSENCVYCAEARRWLNAYRVSFEECFIERDAGCAERYRRLLAPGTPTLLVKGHRQVGFAPERVVQALRGEQAPAP